jgi:predicted aspartyl protease
MPIADYPFTKIGLAATAGPYLRVEIVNPHSGKSLKVYGLIDTGADECCIPASYARLLGHDLKAGGSEKIATAGGSSIAYKHTTKIDVYSYAGPSKVVYTIDEAKIDFCEGLHVVLLGVENFLSEFKFADSTHKCNSSSLV